MGKRSFWRDEDARKKRCERRLESGYISRAYEEEDAKRGKHDRVNETKELQCQYVVLFTEFLREETYQPPDYELKAGAPAPDIVCIKDFIRRYINSSAGCGRIFGGFEDATTSKIVQEDQMEIYSLWTYDSLVFIHGLLKIFILFALQVYIFTGARIGAFVPEHKHRNQRGLRYRHIELVLFCSANEPWRVGWRINQQWLKKNRDEKYTVFGIGIRDHYRLQFATGIFLLIIDLADGALFGIKSVEDLAEFDLRESGLSQIPLWWKETALNKPIFRNMTAKGPQGVALNKERFCHFLRQILFMAGYSKSATIHNIHHVLGQKIEGQHGSAPVSQIYAYRSAGTYLKHYQAHCSSIDTVGDVLGEEEETYHMEDFQGYEQFREVGLPRELPARGKEAILGRSELVARRDRIEQLLADKLSLAYTFMTAFTETWPNVCLQSGGTIVATTCNSGAIAIVKSFSTITLLSTQDTVLVACGIKKSQLMTG
ncbi:hypothetical protein SI65_01212 [Aspergillus cristatus]|uniref:Uncharacterized protein n=1 Tax=Aspergillus cristatus TaxID=573508 RepID=A0A1E3BRM4_ASPCR|nr:hypothetical protein SI65_01212 [Aspergillus cristatus]